MAETGIFVPVGELPPQKGGEDDDTAARFEVPGVTPLGRLVPQVVLGEAGTTAPLPALEIDDGTVTPLRPPKEPKPDREPPQIPDRKAA